MFTVKLKPHSRDVLIELIFIRFPLGNSCYLSVNTVLWKWGGTRVILTGFSLQYPLILFFLTYFVLFISYCCILIQELSYRKQIARQLRPQFVEGISVTLKSRLRVTQGHWKRINGSYGTIGQIIHDSLLVELFDVEYYRDLEMWIRGHSRSLKWYHLKAWVQFPIRLPQ